MLAELLGILGPSLYSSEDLCCTKGEPNPSLRLTLGWPIKASEKISSLQPNKRKYKLQQYPQSLPGDSRL